jgi:hypothetical protein
MCERGVRLYKLNVKANFENQEMKLFKVQGLKPVAFRAMGRLNSTCTSPTRMAAYLDARGSSTAAGVGSSGRTNTGYRRPAAASSAAGVSGVRLSTAAAVPGWIASVQNAGDTRPMRGREEGAEVDNVL